jgi:hypothetical protein
MKLVYLFKSEEEKNRSQSWGARKTFEKEEK